MLAGVSVLQVGNPVAISHFAATPQSDVVRICAHDFQRHGDAFGTTENACFRAFITLRSQFHLHHCSQRTLTEIVSKTPQTLDLSFKEEQIEQRMHYMSCHWGWNKEYPHNSFSSSLLLLSVNLWSSLLVINI